MEPDDDMDGPVGELLAHQMDLIFVPIGEGVEGLMRDTGDEIELGGIRATEPGSGAVAKFLDALPRDRKIAVPYVTSPQLAGMLERRGFTERQRFDPRAGGWGFVWIRKACV